VAHLRQRLADILGTPIGSRVMRRDYGSKMFNLIDRPVNSDWLIDCYAWTAEAIDRWETEFKLTRVQVESINDGHPTLTLEGDYLPDGQEIKMEGIVV
jgi:phage baseplate assembly protein W